MKLLLFGSVLQRFDLTIQCSPIQRADERKKSPNKGIWIETRARPWLFHEIKLHPFIHSFRSPDRYIAHVAAVVRPSVTLYSTSGGER